MIKTFIARLFGLGGRIVDICAVYEQDVPTARCRPGDLAMLIAPGHMIYRPSGNKYITIRAGAMVQVKRLFRCRKTGWAMWELDKPVAYEYKKNDGNKCKGFIVSIADRYLMPIRPRVAAEETLRQNVTAPNAHVLVRPNAKLSGCAAVRSNAG